MIESTLPKRGIDQWGDGAFGAPRGMKNGKPKKHKGIDYACYPDTVIRSPVNGLCNKLGYCYSDDLFYRYVQIKTENGARYRFFYVEPDVVVGDYVHYQDEIGTAQNIAKRYSLPTKYMKNHIHLEILVAGKPVDPEVFHVV